MTESMAKKKSENKPPATTPSSDLAPQGYERFLGELKERIRDAPSSGQRSRSIARC